MKMALMGAVFDVYTPRHQSKGYVRYEPPGLGGARTSVGANAQSRLVGAGIAGIREQGPSTVVNARFGCGFSAHSRVFATVSNLFDRVYYARVGSINT